MHKVITLVFRRFVTIHHCSAK